MGAVEKDMLLILCRASSTSLALHMSQVGEVL